MTPLTPAEVAEKISAIRAIGGIDVDAGLKVVANIGKIYLKVLGLFAQNQERDSELMIAHLAAGDLVSFRTAVHGQKSALASLGILALSAEAAKLEVAAVDGDREFIDANFSAFNAEFAAVAEKIKAVL